MSSDPRRSVLIGPPPTPNGDLHVGHIAGPFLAADVYARHLRGTGRPVLYVTGTDDSQTYVVASARRKGMTPTELAARSAEEIPASLAAVGAAVDGFAPFDDGYRRMVLDFLTPLHAAGKFRERTVRLPYSERTGSFLVEGLVGGSCPVCLLESRGGLCETCGHPNNFDELIDPFATADPTDPVTHREATILVLPLEEYREQLVAYHESKAPYWRPHIVQVMRELLAGPLPDFPITYPLDWGIPAPFAQTPGQVLNAWAEGMPASMYCTAYAQRLAGEDPTSDDELWRAGRAGGDIDLVYFLGFDNAYFWGLTHLALLMAHEGRYVLPSTIVCNEFYELENEKFSTSKGHVVWARDLARDVPRDLARFYLARTAPENARTNFSRAGLAKITRDGLTTPWNRLSATLDKVIADLGAAGAELPVSAAARSRVATMTARFATCYELAGFSLTRVADMITGHVQRLDAVAAALAATVAVDDRDVALARLGDLCHEVRALVSSAAPILIDLADAVGPAPADGTTRALGLPPLPEPPGA